MRRPAEASNGQTMCVLKVMYVYGREVARDTEQVRRRQTQAVEQKITAAQPVLTTLGGNHTIDPQSQLSKPDNR